MKDRVDIERFIYEKETYKYNGTIKEEIKDYAIELIETCSRIGLDNVSFIYKRTMPPYFLEYEKGKWLLYISVDTYQYKDGEFEFIETTRKK